VLAFAVMAIPGRNNFSMHLPGDSNSIGVGSKPSAPETAIRLLSVPHSAIVKTFNPRSREFERIRFINPAPLIALLRIHTANQMLIDYLAVTLSAFRRHDLKALAQSP